MSIEDGNKNGNPTRNTKGRKMTTPNQRKPPQEIGGLDGALYVLTHPREFDETAWKTAMLSRLSGEHGEEAKSMVHALAGHCGTTIPPNALR